MAALARLLHRRRRAVLAAAALLVAAATVFGGPVAGLLGADDDFEDHASESVAARDAIERATGRSAAPDLIALAPVGAVDRVAARAARPRGRRRRHVSRGREGAALARPPHDLRARHVPRRRGRGVGGEARWRRGWRGCRASPWAAAWSPATQVGDQVEADLARAELLAAPLLFLLSLFVFRGFVAALLPLIVGASTIVITFSLLRIVNTIEPMSIFAINLITGAGLGLAIDYSLFMVSRYREERENGREGADALVATMRTAGRTVLFSATTVAAAMAALIVFRQRFLFSMGVGGALVALTAALVSVTLLPTLLAVLGPRVDALSPRRWRRAAARDAAQVRARRLVPAVARGDAAARRRSRRARRSC